ncbi:MAG: hypothetical protein ABIA63_02500, partial [bacterium]
KEAEAKGGVNRVFADAAAGSAYGILIEYPKVIAHCMVNPLIAQLFIFQVTSPEGFQGMVDEFIHVMHSENQTDIAAYLSFNLAIGTSMGIHGVAKLKKVVLGIKHTGGRKTFTLADGKKEMVLTKEQVDAVVRELIKQEAKPYESKIFRITSDGKPESGSRISRRISPEKTNTKNKDKDKKPPTKPTAPSGGTRGVKRAKQSPVAVLAKAASKMSNDAKTYVSNTVNESARIMADGINNIADVIAGRPPKWRPAAVGSGGRSVPVDARKPAAKKLVNTGNILFAKGREKSKTVDTTAVENRIENAINSNEDEFPRIHHDVSGYYLEVIDFGKPAEKNKVQTIIETQAEIKSNYGKNIFELKEIPDEVGQKLITIMKASLELDYLIFERLKKKIDRMMRKIEIDAYETPLDPDYFLSLSEQERKLQFPYVCEAEEALNKFKESNPHKYRKLLGSWMKIDVKARVFNDAYRELFAFFDFLYIKAERLGAWRNVGNAVEKDPQCSKIYDFVAHINKETIRTRKKMLELSKEIYSEYTDLLGTSGIETLSYFGGSFKMFFGEIITPSQYSEAVSQLSKFSGYFRTKMKSNDIFIHYGLASTEDTIRHSNKDGSAHSVEKVLYVTSSKMRKVLIHEVAHCILHHSDKFDIRIVKWWASFKKLFKKRNKIREISAPHILELILGGGKSEKIKVVEELPEGFLSAVKYRNKSYMVLCANTLGMEEWASRPEEFFAECLRVYLNYPEKLKKYDPELYNLFLKFNHNL